MTYHEFSRHLGKAGITVKEFALLLKKHPNSLTNNAQKNRIPNEIGVIAALIGEMADKKIDFKSVIGELEIIKRKARGSAEVGKFGGNPQTSLLKNNKDVTDV